MSSYEAATPPAKRSNVVKVLHWGDSPAIIRCLIGSIRFKNEFESAAKAFSNRGEVVLAPHIYSNGAGLNKEETDLLHEMNLKRIEMSDIVFVINPNNRTNDNVLKEIEYAESLGRTVMYLETPANK